MEFQKTCTFLGYKEFSLRDGTVLYTVSFYLDDSTIEVNIQATNVAVAGPVKSLSFGDTVVVTFALRKVDKLYKLSLVAVA